MRLFSLKILFSLILLFIIPLKAYGEIVTYVDKEGVIHITDLISDRPLGMAPKTKEPPPPAPLPKNGTKTADENAPKKELTLDALKKGTVTIKTNDSLGSGFLVTPSGYIVTNSHVIKENRFVQVLFHDGKTREAYIVRNLPESDLALIKVQGDNYSFLKGNEAINFKEGDDVYVVGAPQGLHYTVTQGIISSLRKVMVNGKNLLFIQTDAPVSRGSSGSPLIRKIDGKVIGMITFKSAGQGSEGLGFALAYEEVKRLLNLDSIINQ